MKSINKLIDHTLLKAFATESDIKKLCEEALEYDFASVCVGDNHIPNVLFLSSIHQSEEKSFKNLFLWITPIPHSASLRNTRKRVT